MDPGAATGSEKEGFAGPDLGVSGGGAAKKLIVIVLNKFHCSFDENILPIIVNKEPTLVPNKKANVDMSNLPMAVR